MKYKLLVIMATLTFTHIGFAQVMYRCGNTFSQTQCAPDAKVIAAAGVAQPIKQSPADPERVEKMKEECRHWIIAAPSWKDKDSVKIGTFTVAKLEYKSVEGVNRLVRPYIAEVNAKNSYGGYVGETPHVCYANADDTKFIAYFP